MLQPIRMWRLSDSDLYCVAMKMRRSPELMQLLSDEVDDAVRAAEVDGRLGAILRQRIQALAGAAGEHDDQAVVEQRRHGVSVPPQHDAGRRAVGADDPQRQAEHLVDARLDVAQVQPLDDDGAAAEQHMVRRRARLLELLDRQVVDADDLDAVVDEIAAAPDSVTPT